jgi:hypothetical protein
MVRPDGQREPLRFITSEAKDDGAAFGFDVHHRPKRPIPERHRSFSSNIAAHRPQHALARWISRRIGVPTVQPPAQLQRTIGGNCGATVVELEIVGVILAGGVREGRGRLQWLAAVRRVRGSGTGSPRGAMLLSSFVDAACRVGWHA